MSTHPLAGQDATEPVEWFTWEDKDGDGKLEYPIIKKTDVYTIEEKVSFNDTNGNGKFDFSDAEIDPNQPHSVVFSDPILTYASAKPVNQNDPPIFVLVREKYEDYNGDEIYNDADYPSGGLQVRH